MPIEIKEREWDEYRHLRGARKTLFWRRHKEAIIAQGKADERRELEQKKKYKRS